MPRFEVTTKSHEPSRTDDSHRETIEAENIVEAWRKARKISEVAWGYRNIVSIEEIRPSSQEEELKKGYVALAEEDAKINKEWEPSTLESWPEY